MDKMKLSLCMIVKNEEKVLGRCLSSVTGAAIGERANDSPIDEIVIIDTGSNDKTKEIAAAFGASVFDFTWTDDFSAARNFAFSKVSGDYILWLDADDEVTPKAREKLFALKEKLFFTRAPSAFCRYEIRENDLCAASGERADGEKISAVQTIGDTQAVDDTQTVGDAEKTVLSFYRTRVIKNDENAVWRGRVHEYLPRQKGELFEGQDGFFVVHRGRKTGHGARNLSIYRKQISLGEPMSERDLFYYGKELYENGFFTESYAIETEFCGKRNAWHVNLIEAARIRAACLLKKGDSSSAKRVLFEAFDYGAPRASVLCDLAKIYKDEGQTKTAYFFYRGALESDDHAEEGDFSCEAYRGEIPLIEMVYCAYAFGDERQARLLHEECMRRFPHHPSVVYNQAFFSCRTKIEKR